LCIHYFNIVAGMCSTPTKQVHKMKHQHLATRSQTFNLKPWERKQLHK